MLLVIDVGNTNTVLGIYRKQDLLHCWRLTTARDRTADEWGILIRTLFHLGDISNGTVTAIVVSSVVPPARPALEEVALRYFGVQAFFIEATMDLGMPVLYNPPPMSAPTASSTPLQPTRNSAAPRSSWTSVRPPRSTPYLWRANTWAASSRRGSASPRRHCFCERPVCRASRFASRKR